MTLGRIVTFEAPGTDLKIQKFPVHAIGAEEVLIKITYTTLCGSDLHTFCGLRKEITPTVLGHEITGTIISIGTLHNHTDYTGKALQIGDHVTWSVFANEAVQNPDMPQKGSKLFKYGHAQVTEQDVFHGGLGDYCILKKGTAIFKLSNSLPAPIAATINCAIATAAGAIRITQQNLRNKTICVTGIGLLGINVIALCKQLEAQHIIAADINAQRLQTALAFGADSILNLTKADHLLPNNVDIHFDMSGSPEAMELGLSMLQIGGTAIWVGAVFKNRTIAVDAEQMIRKMITIKGLHNYNYEDLSIAVQFIEQHWQTYPFSDLIEKEYPLEQAQLAFEYAAIHRPFRVGIRIEPS